jgi:exopolysaccharide biosynthesis polyprenyl glycosylphosphotransferase
VRAVFYRVLRSRMFSERVLIIGTGPLAHMVVEAVEAEPSGRYRIVGLADDGTGVGAAFPQYPVLGPLEDLGRVIDTVRPDRIVVALQERRGKLRVNPLLEARLRDIEVEEGAELYERLTGKLAIESLTPASLIFCRDFRRRPLVEVMAHGISVATALVALVVFAPLLALIAIAIKLDSEGPVFFVQERVGRLGRPFRLIKFRTMREAPGDHSEWAADNGFRITRVGHWLRKFRFDELPQFANILRGDMDLVGPRPHPTCNFSLFVTVLRNSPECGEQIPYYSLRSVVRPGMTGWAQVRYRYANNLEEEIEKMRYDLYYVKHRSVWLDLRILADTLKTVVMGHGAGERSRVSVGEPQWQLVVRPR